MLKTSVNKKMQMPNILLIAGNGRNVGKTHLACRIIENISATNEVIGLKISPHFHECNPSNIISESDNFIILDEKQINSKDSSQMLQAGAKRVFYVMAKQENLADAFGQIADLLQNKPVVCESAGLIEFIQPGIFLFLSRPGEKLVKTNFLKYNPVRVKNNGKEFDFDFKRIDFQNHTFKLMN